jgi:hypothetical protein
MAFNLKGAINEGYRAGKPVIVLSNEGKVLHGRRTGSLCVPYLLRSFVESRPRKWVKSDWPKTMEARWAGILRLSKQAVEAAGCKRLGCLILEYTNNSR